MTNEKQEKNERGAANQAASQNGRGRRNGGNGNGNGSRKNNTSFKRVNLERKRPQLSRGEGADGAQRSENRRSRRGSKASKDPNAKLRIIPLGGLDAIGKNMTAFECGGDII